MNLNLHLPETIVLKPCITVFGVGGAGGNAINNMISSNLEGVKFVVANTDAQALENSLATRRIQLGEVLTRGLGAGAVPTVGKAAAEESINEVLADLEGSNMVFITAGMGGGTGTGAAPVIAKMAREQGILTVGVVTKPFHFEGSKRMKLAEEGLLELQKYVDTLIIIPNQNLFRIANEKTTFADAFKMADDVLHSGVRGVTDLMMMPGLINLDFADIRTVMSEMGKAMMGTGEASGDKRSLHAAEAAISNPLLDNVSMKGARGVLINITGGADMTLFEVDEAANRIRDEVDPDANIIFGSAFNPDLEGRIRVSVVATGIDSHLMTAGGYAATTASQAPAPRPAPTPAPAIEAPHAEVAPQPNLSASVVPSVPQQPILEKTVQPTQHYQEVDFSQEADSAVFIAPRPMEPRVQPQISDHQPRTQAEPKVTARPNPAPQADFRTEEKYVEKEAPRSDKLGLFGRMANSIRGTSYEQEELPIPTTKASEERKEHQAETPHKEDILDIPSYLRRKTTH